MTMVKVTLTPAADQPPLSARNQDELEAAKLLLSVSPASRPVTRPRSFSLEALCDVALGDPSVSGLGSQEQSSTSLTSFALSRPSLSMPHSRPSTILSSLRTGLAPVQEVDDDDEDEFPLSKRPRRSTRILHSEPFPLEKRIGIYTLAERKERIARFVEKRNRRVWVKKIRYSCRKNLAQTRMRVKGRFVSSKNQEDDGDSGS